MGRAWRFVLSGLSFDFVSDFEFRISARPLQSLPYG